MPDSAFIDALIGGGNPYSGGVIYSNTGAAYNYDDIISQINARYAEGKTPDLAVKSGLQLGLPMDVIASFPGVTPSAIQAGQNLISSGAFAPTATGTAADTQTAAPVGSAQYNARIAAGLDASGFPAQEVAMKKALGTYSEPSTLAQISNAGSVANNPSYTPIYASYYDQSGERPELKFDTNTIQGYSKRTPDGQIAIYDTSGNFVKNQGSTSDAMLSNLGQFAKGVAPMALAAIGASLLGGAGGLTTAGMGAGAADAALAEYLGAGTGIGGMGAGAADLALQEYLASQAPTSISELASLSPASLPGGPFIEPLPPPVSPTGGPFVEPLPPPVAPTGGPFVEPLPPPVSPTSGGPFVEPLPPPVSPVVPGGTPSVIPGGVPSVIPGLTPSVTPGLLDNLGLKDLFSGLGGASLLSSLLGLGQGAIGASAAKDAAQIQADAANKALAQQQSMFDTLNNQQAPGRGAGYAALNQIRGMLPGQYTQYDEYGKPIGAQQTGTGYLTQQFGPEQFAQGIDPGYAFRLQQGQMANQRAANVGGGLIGGNALQGLQDYTQGQASQEYGNAFNRFQNQQTNIYNKLAGIAGLGQNAQNQTNTLGTNLANAQSQLGIGSAAAQAAGNIGAANAYSGALGGAGQNYMLSQLLSQNQNVAQQPLINQLQNYNASSGPGPSFTPPG